MSNGIGMGKDTQEALSGSFNLAIRLFCDGLRTVVKLTRKSSKFMLQQAISVKYGEDKLKPLIKEVENTDLREVYSVNIPPGLSFNTLKNMEDELTVASGNETVVKKYKNRYTIEVLKGELPNMIHYNFDNFKDDLKGYIPTVIGVDVNGKYITYDLSTGCHWLIAGNTNMGKSNCTHVMLTTILLSQANVKVFAIDYKKVEFSYLKKFGLQVAHDDEGALSMLTYLYEEVQRRLNILDKLEVEKIQECNTDLPYIVLLIDELSEMEDAECQKLLRKLLKLSRCCGYSIICATQRPSADLFKQFSNSRALFAARICFPVASKEDSRIAGVEGAEKLTTQGRCILSHFGEDITLQVPYLPVRKAKELVKEYLIPVQQVKNEVEEVVVSETEQKREHEAIRLRA